jgi:hypothetical protein
MWETYSGIHVIWTSHVLMGNCDTYQFRSAFLILAKQSQILFNVCQLCPTGCNSLILCSHWSQKFGLHQSAIAKFQWTVALDFARNQWYLTYPVRHCSHLTYWWPKNMPSLNQVSFFKKNHRSQNFGLRKWLAVWISTWKKTQKKHWFRCSWRVGNLWLRIYAYYHLLI